MAPFLDEEEQPQREATPTLSAVFRRAARAGMAEMKVSMPAEVVTYDHKTQKATVRPYFQRKYNDGKLEEPPIIYGVTVWQPRAGDAFVHMPVKPGHVVHLIFSDRSLDKWLSSGKQGDPGDTRMHHISDAVAYPGGYPFSNNAKVSNANDVIIGNIGDGNKLEIRIKTNGHIQILNGTNELLKTMDDWFQVMRDAVIYTCNGPQRLRHNQLSKVHKRLKTFREK